MSNSYQTPQFDPKQFRDQPSVPAAAVQDYGWVKQVRLFAILNGIQGVLELLFGMLAMSMGVLMPFLLQIDKAQKAQEGGEGQPESFVWAITALYVTIGTPVLVSGILRMVAAMKNYRFRGRVLGLVSVFVGLGSIFSVYCAPTGIGLLIYGLILYLNPAVKAAFEMARQGQSVAQIMSAFSPYKEAYYAPSAGGSTASGSEPRPATGENPFGEA